MARRKMSLADKRALAKQVQQERENLYAQEHEEARTRYYAEYEAAVASKRSELLADQQLHGGAADVAMADRGFLTGRWSRAWDKWHSQNPQIKDLKATANRAFAEWEESRGPSPWSAAADRKLLQRIRRRSKKNLEARLEVVDLGWEMEQYRKSVDVQWGPGYAPNDLVETPDGMVGIIVKSWSCGGLHNSYVRVLVDGIQRDYKKIKVTPL